MKPALFFLFVLAFFDVYSQCSSLRQQRNITFNTDKDCAPVSVTDFTITYFFNTPQDPADVMIRFEWNDPDDNVDEYGQGDPGFIIRGGNTEFTAAGTFTYPENDQCVFEPVSSMIVGGEVCETSTQTQVVASWSRDNDFGGNIAIDPGEFDVCLSALRQMLPTPLVASLKSPFTIGIPVIPTMTILITPIMLMLLRKPPISPLLIPQTRIFKPD